MFITFKIFLFDDRDEPPNFITFKAFGQFRKQMYYFLEKENKF